MATTLTRYLSFDGTTRDAFAFYEGTLGAKIEAMLRHADMPPTPGPPPATRRAAPTARRPRATASCTPARACRAARCCSPAMCRRAWRSTA
jgi:hypothetical protein